MCKFLTDINRVNFTDKDLCILRNFNTCKRRNCYRLLANDFSIKSAVNDNGFTNLIKLIFFKEITASVFKFLTYFFINCFINDS